MMMMVVLMMTIMVEYEVDIDDDKHFTAPFISQNVTSTCFNNFLPQHS